MEVLRDLEQEEPAAEAELVDTSRLYLGAISPWQDRSDPMDSDFCVDESVAACQDKDNGMTEAWFTDASGDFTWEQRNVVWFYRDPSQGCEWTYHCKYSADVGMANYGQSLDRCTSDTCVTLQTTMRRLLDASAACEEGNSGAARVSAVCGESNAASAMLAPSLALAGVSLLAAVAY